MFDVDDMCHFEWTVDTLQSAKENKCIQTYELDVAVSEEVEAYDCRSRHVSVRLNV